MLQTQVTNGPRSTSEVLRPENVTAENGAVFTAVLDGSDEGVQAYLAIYLSFGGDTRTFSDNAFFTTDQEALSWLDQHARSRGFREYKIERRI